MTEQKHPQSSDVNKYGNGIVVDWSSTEIANREFNETAQVELVFAETQSDIIPITIKAQNANARMHLTVTVEKNVSVTLAETFTMFEYIDLRVDVILKDGATCTYISNCGVENSFKKIKRHAYVSTNANMTWIDLVHSGIITQSHISSQLNGEGAAASTYGIFSGKKTQVFDIAHVTTHVAAHTTSRMMTNGMLHDASKAVYRSNIIMLAGSTQASGQQKLDAFMLSPQAEIDAIPNLDIQESAVSCLHGVSIARPKKESVFYLESRGVSEQEAIAVMTEGKKASIIHLLPGEIQEFITGQI